MQGIHTSTVLSKHLVKSGSFVCQVKLASCNKVLTHYARQFYILRMCIIYYQVINYLSIIN